MSGLVISNRLDQDEPAHLGKNQEMKLLKEMNELQSLETITGVE
jgi:hypothetical protein